jgi:hypothetical protein
MLRSAYPDALLDLVLLLAQNAAPQQKHMNTAIPR